MDILQNYCFLFASSAIFARVSKGVPSSDSELSVLVVRQVVYYYYYYLLVVVYY